MLCFDCTDFSTPARRAETGREGFIRAPYREALCGDCRRDRAENDAFDRENQPGACPVCGGECAALGTLGNRLHVRCRDCGMDSSSEVTVSTCQWFALCDHPATGAMAHPVLGDVPICDRCRAKIESLESK